MKNVLLDKDSIGCLNHHDNHENFIKGKARTLAFPQIIQVMKLTAILILMAFMQVSAKSYSQNVTLNETNSSLDKVFTEIRKQTGYDFLYNRLLKNTMPVTVKASNMPLEKVLNEVLKGQPLTYSILDNTIVLKRKEDRLMEQVAGFPSLSSRSNTQTFSLGEMVGVTLSGNVNEKVVVNGKVIDATGGPLPGVSVKVKGTAVGTTTDMNGNFSINAPDNATLVFTYIGFATQEVAVNGRSSINITLTEDAKTLSEVVVTALGVTKEKRGLGYGTSEVRGDEFKEARFNNVASALTGKIAGVDATQVAAGPGASSRVIIRGNTSLNNNQQPLYVVDGLPINNVNRTGVTSSGGLNVDRGDGISSMNPDDIETISVLKGGAAAALYGSQAANGVILITTKKGTAQKGIGVEVTSTGNWGTPYVFPNYQYVYGQGDDGIAPINAAKALSTGRLSFGAKIDPSKSVLQFDGTSRPYGAVNVKENIKNFYRPEQNITNNIAFNAGNQSLNMRLSVSDLRSQAAQPNSSYTRQTVNLNARGKMGPKDLFVVEGGIQYNVVKGKNRPNAGYAELNAAWPVYLAANTVDVRNMIGDPNNPGINPVTGKELEWNPVPAAVNPYYVAYQAGNSDNQQRFIGRGSVQMNIMSNLFVKGSASRDFIYNEDQAFVPLGNAFTPLGYYNSGVQQRGLTNFQLLANYNEKFLGDKVGLDLMVGGSQERSHRRENEANGTQFIVPNFISVTNLQNRDLVGYDLVRTGTNSVFSEATVDYNNVVFLTASGRQDWFSTLNPGFNSIFYPAFSSSVILSDIVKMPSFLSYVKLRGAWAQVGSATVAAGSINQTYRITSAYNAYGLPTQSNPTELRNPGIRPLTVTTTEGGFETQFFANRLGVDFTYYVKNTTNDILRPPLSATTGYSAGNQNMGLIRNTGIELMLTGSPIKKESFGWDISMPFGWNKSEILELAPGIETLSLGSGIGGVTLINAVGLPYSTVRGQIPLVNADGVPVYNPANGYPTPVVADLGVGNPPYQVGMTNNFRYKRFGLDIVLDGKFGAVGYSNLMQYATRFGLTQMTLPGRENGLTVTGVTPTGAPFTKTHTVQEIDTYYNNFSNLPGVFVYDTDFIKLRSAVLRYTLPASVLKVIRAQSASVGINGLNLATLYRTKELKEAGLDPEFQATTGNAQGSQGVEYPRLRTIGFNLNLRF
jgi:TonB-linked SusC/RagA family outer membrane protein